MENIKLNNVTSSFNEIISFDENSNFKRMDETAAIEYFLNCNDEVIKNAFLDKFAIYIKKGLEAREFPNNTMQDLMFVIYYLYDDPFFLLVQFDELVESITARFWHRKFLFSNIDTKENMKRYFSIITDIISDVKDTDSHSDLKLSTELKTQLIMYRNDVEFNKRKKAFLDQYKDVDEEQLKKAFEYYISKEYKEDGSKRNKLGFFGYNEDRCNRYEIYHRAYTYSLKTYGDEKTKELFQPSGGKYLITICENSNLDDFLNLKRTVASSYLNIYGNTYDLSLGVFGNRNYKNKLEELFDKVNKSFTKDFKQVVLKYKAIMEEDKNSMIQAIIDKVDFHSFVESDCRSIKDYCERKGIDTAVFKKALSYLNDENMLRKIEEKKQELSSTRFAIINSKADRIVDYMIHGVPIDDKETREFDYLDYKIMTNLELDDFRKIVGKNASPETARVVGKFVGKHKNSRNISISSILESKTIIGYGTDKEHEITEEEKLATIEYLRDNHLISKNGTIDSKIYNIAIKRYLSGTLFDENIRKINLKI